MVIVSDRLTTIGNIPTDGSKTSRFSRQLLGCDITVISGGATRWPRGRFAKLKLHASPRAVPVKQN
jgi:hypothetical protein